ncbi:hypothetical protein H5410_021884 [Solanum commersonii]|uniref:Uncharacterized protein n=1 Tax=Solanum commersonii TaxID=4109 RepID=A0A9J5ZCB3_SOLCO|nr:hypothetical protein H5410_021884 [Solanum commersonii]
MPSCTILQHHRTLGHCATWYCFAKLLSDTQTAPFFCRLDHVLQGSAHCNKRQSKTLRRLAKWTQRSSGLHFFVLFSLFTPFCDQTQFQPLKKGVSNSATQDSIMNIHNKTQFTYAKIKCALKDSSCDSSITKNLMLTILSSNASSSSTIFKVSESDATLTLTKMKTMHAFTHRFAQNRFDKWLITTRCKEFTYCLCNFIWPHRSRTLMFVRL